MKFTILGTGTSQGIPVIGCHCRVCRSANPKDHRLRTSMLVESDAGSIVVDTGPDFRQQMLAYGVDHLNGALMTHEHNDHVAGLDDIRPFNFIAQEAFPLYGLPRSLTDIRKRYGYIFAEEKYPGSPSVELHPIDPWTEVEVAGIRVTALPVMHGRLKILGYHFRNLAYFTDVKTIDPEVVDRITGVKFLIINALHHKPHHSHLNLEEALALIEKIRPGNAFLNHISHSMGLHEEINKSLPDNVKLAFDGMTIEM